VVLGRRLVAARGRGLEAKLKRRLVVSLGQRASRALAARRWSSDGGLGRRAGGKTKEKRYSGRRWRKGRRELTEGKASLWVQLIFWNQMVQDLEGIFLFVEPLRSAPLCFNQTS
jgi:hypothetical protein